MINNKRKLYGFILGTIMFVMLLVSFSYAFYTWRSSESDVSVTISDSYFYCESGVSGSGVLPVTSNYKSGITQSVKVNNVGKSDTNISMSLNIKSVKDSSGNNTDSLFDSSMEYVVMVDTTGGNNDCTTSNSCTQVATGDFSDFKVGMNTLVENISLPNNSRYEYYLFLYINENEENNAAMQGVTLNYTLDICEVVAFFDYRGGVVTEEFRKLTEETYGTSSNPLPSPTHNDHVITYNTNGGSAVSNSSVSYTFDGWYLDETFTSDKKVVDSTNVQKTTNHTLYANWIASGNVTLPAAPTKTGYIFEGWYSDSGLTNKVGDVGDSYTPDVLKTSTTLYAKWTPITYTVEYYNGSTKLGSSTHTYDSAKNLTTWANLGGTVTNSDKGWSFYGWGTNTANTTRTYTNGQSVNNLSSTNGSVVKLYSIYNRTVNFKHGVNSASSSSPTQYWNPYGTTNGTHVAGITSPAITSISNWTSLGWRYDTTASDKEIGSATSATIYPTVTSTNTLYAVYSRTLTVSYNGNGSDGGSTADTTKTVYMNTNSTTTSSQSITLAANGFTRTNYSFNSWNINSAGTGTSYNPNASYNPNFSYDAASFSKTLYAKWDATTVTLTFTVNNSDYGWVVEESAGPGDYIEIPNIPYGTTYTVDGDNFRLNNEEHNYAIGTMIFDLDGYTTTFVDWTIDGEIITSGTITGNQTFTAVFNRTVNTYTIEYYNGSTKINSSDHTYGTAKNLTTWETLGATVTNSDKGWSFAGWSTSNANTTRTYTDGQSVNNLTSTNGDTVKLYAVYSRSVTFYHGLNNASSSSSTQYWNPYGTTSGTHVSYVTSPGISSISNWTALGWRYDTTASTQVIGGATSSTIYPAVDQSNTLYAVYSRSYTAYFYSGVNVATTKSKSSDTAYYNSGQAATPTTVSLTLDTAANSTDITYWTELGWRDDTTNGNKEYDYGASITVSWGTHFYSVYSRSYTANFYSGVNKATTKTKTSSTVYYNSGQASTPTTVSITLDTAANSTDVSSWTESGWRDDTTNGNKEYDYGATVTVAWNTHFYSIYTRSYTANFYSGVNKATTKTKTSSTAYYNSGQASTPTTVSITLDTAANSTDVSSWTESGWRKDTTNAAKEYDYAGTATVAWGTNFYSIYTRSYTATFYSGVNKATTKTKASNTGYYNSGQASTPTTVSITLDTAANSTDISSWTESGWRDDTTNAAKEYNYAGSATVAWGTNFYSVYSRTLTVSYDGNGSTSGSTADTTKTVYMNTNSTTTSSQSITLAANGFTRTNYSFNSWNTNSAGTGTSYNPNASYNPNFSYDAASFSKTLYAKWSATNVNVTFDSGNLVYGLTNTSSAVSSNSMSYTIADKVVSVTGAAADGYGFTTGRVYLIAGTTYYFSCTSSGTWGATGGDGSVEAFLMLNGSSPYYRMDSNNNFSFTPSTTGEYWLRLDVNANGTTHTFSDITVKQKTILSFNIGENYTFPTTQTKNRYTFSGWYTAESDGTAVTTSTTVTNTSAHTLYGQWTENYLTVNYYSNYATSSFSGALNTVSANSNVLVKTATFSADTAYPNGLHNYKASSAGTYLGRTGYTATGNWGTSTSGGTLVSQSTGFTSGYELASTLSKDIGSSSTSISLYPQWTANQIYVQYNMNGGTWGGSTNTSLSTDSSGYVLLNGSRTVATYSYGETNINLADYGNSGYINIRKLGRIADNDKAWNTKADGTGTSFSMVGGVSANDLCDASSGDCTVTLYVNWRYTKLTINYYSNGATSAFSGALNSVSSGTNVLVRYTINYYSDSASDGLWNYSALSSSTYLGREGYAATEYWGTSTSGGTLVSQNTPYGTNAELATALGKDISYADASINLYAQWGTAYYKVNTTPTYYTDSLNEAIYNANQIASGKTTSATADGDTITMLASLTDNSSASFSYDCTFNPNGYTLTRTSTQIDVETGYTLTITGSGKIVGTADASNAKFLIAAYGTAGITVASGSTVTLENNYHTLGLNNGTINLKGGTITSNSYSGAVVIYQKTGTINVAGATVNGATTNQALYINGGAGKINFSSGTLNGGNGIYNSNGTVTMTGGTINATAGKNGIYFLGTSTGTISGGTINATGDDSSIAWAISNNGTGTVNISGGTFKGTGTRGRGIQNYSTGNILMTGGKITSNGADGLLVYNNSTGGVKLHNAKLSMTYTNSSNNSSTAVQNGHYQNGSHAEMLISGTTNITIADGEAIKNFGGDLRIYEGTITSGSASKGIYNLPTTSEGVVTHVTNVAATDVIPDTERSWGKAYVRGASVTGGTYGIYSTAGNYSVQVGRSDLSLVTSASSPPVVIGKSNAAVGGNKDCYIYLENGTVWSYNRDEYAVQGGHSYVKTRRSGYKAAYKDNGSGSYHGYYLKAA